MKKYTVKSILALGVGLALVFSGCSTWKNPEKAQTIDKPSAPVPKADKDLYSKALEAQKKGQLEAAIQLWKEYLSKNPDSHEAHNNLGLIYYNQDQITQALQEFETAFRMQPEDPETRANLVMGLRFKADMFHENREYFKTLKILERMETLVPEREKQSILFYQEQVEDQIFIQVMETDTTAAYKDFIRRFPDGLNAVRAKEFLEQGSSRSARADYPKKRKTKRSRKPTKAVESGSFASGGSAQALPDYGAPSGSSQPTATYTPPTEEEIAVHKNKSRDIFGMDPKAMDSIEEAHVGDSGQASTDDFVIIPSDQFAKPGRVEGPAVDSAAEAPRAGEEQVRAQPQLKGDALDTHADLEMPEAPEQPEATESKQESAVAEEVAQTESLHVEENQPENAGVESTPVAEAEPEPAPEMATAQAEPEQVASSEPATQDASSATEDIPEVDPAAIAKALKEVEEEMARQNRQKAGQEENTVTTENAKVEADPSAQDPDPDQEAIAQALKEIESKSEPAQVPETESSPIAESPPVDEKITAADADLESIDQALEEAEKELAEAEVKSQENQAATPMEEEEPVETSDSATAAAEPQPVPAVDEESLSQTVASLIPTPKPAAEPVSGEEHMASVPSAASLQKVVVIQVTEGSTLNVRAEPSSGGEILGYLENGDMMPFMKEANGWYQIKIDEGVFGWVSKKFAITEDIESDSPLTFEGENEEDIKAAVDDAPMADGLMVEITVSSGSTLNVRSMPSPDGAVVDMLEGGDTLPLVRESGDWYQLRFEDDSTGWVSKQFSKVVADPDVPPMMTPESMDDVSGTGSMEAASPKGPVTTVVVIKIDEGSTLNVRSVPSSQGEVLGSLKNGEMRPLMNESGDWYQVELPGGQSGWVNQKFSSKVDLGAGLVPTP